MTRDNNMYYKRDFIYGVLLAMVACIFTIKIPYQGKSIAELIIPVLKFENTTVYLSGIIPLVLIVVSSHFLVKSGRFKRRLLVSLILLLVVMPMLGKGLDLLKSPIYMMNGGVKSIELRDPKLKIHGYNEEISIAFDAEVKSYVDDDKDVHIFVELPAVLKEIVKQKEILIYETSGLTRGRKFDVEYSGILELEEGYTCDDLFSTNYYREDYTIILVDDTQSIVMEVNDGLF